MTANDGVIERGIRLLLSRQTTQGDWEQEGISGVFNGNCNQHTHTPTHYHIVVCTTKFAITAPTHMMPLCCSMLQV